MYESQGHFSRSLCSPRVSHMKVMFFVCRPIAHRPASSMPSHKNPSVRPIGIGDTTRRIIAKAVLFIAGSDIQDAAGCLQLCGGQMSGIEAAVHTTRSAFESENVEAVLLVDASNAFNCINRQVALQNIRHLCPTIATILINSYRTNIDLFVDGEVIRLQEGTTQGDPLAIAMYGLATIPLIRSSMAPRSRFGTRMTRLLADPLTNYGTGGTSYLPKGLPLDTSRTLRRPGS